MRFALVAIIALLVAGCVTTGASSPSYYAYSDAVKLLEKNVSTYEQVKGLYGECGSRENVNGGYRCIWRNSNTVVRSTESYGANSVANFDPGRSAGRFTYTTVYTSTLTAVFSNDDILRAFTVSNQIEK